MYMSRTPGSRGGTHVRWQTRLRRGGRAAN